MRYIVKVTLVEFVSNLLFPGGKRADVSATSGIESIELFLYTALLIVI